MQPDSQNQPTSEAAQTPEQASDAASSQPQSTTVASDTMPIADPMVQTPAANLTVPDEPVFSQEPIHWQAQEYVHHERSALWFVVFAVVVFGLMAVSIFLMKAYTFTVLIPIMAAAVIVYVRRPPRVLSYTLSDQGLYINDKLYPLAEYKSFAVIQDDREYSILLIPVKRFMPGVSVYFPENSGQAIVDMLGVRMPMEERKLDPVDRFLRKIRM